MYYAMNGFGLTPEEDARLSIAKSVDAYVLPIGHVALEFKAASDIEAQGMDQRVWNMPLKPTLGGLKKLWDSGQGLVNEKNLVMFTGGDPSAWELIAGLFNGGALQVLYRDVVRLTAWTTDIANAAQRSEKSGDLSAAACYYYALALTLRSVNKILNKPSSAAPYAKIAEQYRQKLIDDGLAKFKGFLTNVAPTFQQMKDAPLIAAAKAAGAKAVADAAAQLAAVKAAGDAQTKKLQAQLAEAQKAAASAQQAAQQAAREPQVAAPPAKDQTMLYVAAGVAAVAILGAVFYARKK